VNQKSRRGKDPTPKQTKPRKQGTLCDAWDRRSGTKVNKENADHKADGANRRESDANSGELSPGQDPITVQQMSYGAGDMDQ
jgi:hypothetical protein